MADASDLAMDEPCPASDQPSRMPLETLARGAASSAAIELTAPPARAGPPFGDKVRKIDLECRHQTHTICALGCALSRYASGISGLERSHSNYGCAVVSGARGGHPAGSQSAAH